MLDICYTQGANLDILFNADKSYLYICSWKELWWDYLIGVLMLYRLHEQTVWNILVRILFMEKIYVLTSHP